MDYQKITEEITRLALEAGEIIMEIYNSPDFEVRSKSDDSPVTAADEAADAHISAGLKTLFPDIALVTEEQADSHKLQASTFFIVDPLDGTKEFIHRRGDFTVNIALVEDGVPTHGVVYAPAKNRLFRTRPEGGAEEMAADGAGRKEIKVAQPDLGALRVVASKSHRSPELETYIARYQVADSVAAGSSLKFCLLATGEADLYPRVGRTMEWDTAAGQAVLMGAGGFVDRLDGTGPLTYGKAGFENPYFICYAPEITPLSL